MDPVLDKEIQNLIDSNIGDTSRLQFIKESLQGKKNIYNSDKKYLSELLSKNSKDEDILERLDHYLNPKIIKSKPTEIKKPTQILYSHEKWCALCNRAVVPERDLSTGALLVLLLFGILPGLIYYAIKSKTCPICKHDNWVAPPKK